MREPLTTMPTARSDGEAAIDSLTGWYRSGPLAGAPQVHRVAVPAAPQVVEAGPVGMVNLLCPAGAVTNPSVPEWVVYVVLNTPPLLQLGFNRKPRWLAMSPGVVLVAPPDTAGEFITDSESHVLTLTIPRRTSTRALGSWCRDEGWCARGGHAAAGARGAARGFARGELRVLGEVTAQYAGLTLSDEQYDPYLSLAEEFDLPVSVHTGMGPPGGSYDPCCRKFRANLGSPAWLEECLNRHPKLRLNIMHAGWPYLEATIAVLFTYPQVYTDLGAIDWAAPRGEFHAYLGALMRAGFGKRVMFGSDHMYWPEAIEMAVHAIESADFLSPGEKRDILYHNAVRFLRL